MKFHANVNCLLLVSIGLTACSGGEHDVPQAAAPSEAVEAKRLSPPAFDGVISSLPVSGQCALDVLNGVPIKSSLAGKPGDALTFSGWVADPQGKVPTKAQFVLNSAAATYAFPVALGGTREDVMNVMKNPNLRQSGYDVGIDVSGGVPGEYDLALVLGEAPGVLCPLNLKFTISR